MMKLILSLTLIWTLSSTAEALDCLQTTLDSDIVQKCRNSTKMCATVARQDNENGKVVKSTQKLCSSDFTEGKHTFSLNFGYDAITASIQACTTSLCNNQTIEYPGVQKKNGLKCFACNDSSSTGCNQTVECVGVQDRCINGTGERQRYMNTFYTLGCVSANICEDARLLYFFRGVKFSRKPKCCRGNLCNSAWSVKLNVMSLLLGLFTLTFY